MTQVMRPSLLNRKKNKKKNEAQYLINSMLKVEIKKISVKKIKKKIDVNLG
jgi:hypothetical protein